ncbi:hypothetical protein SLS60_001768 [Paraconiothyrium brasiliense]|uniref:Uncharacterized protein n=1 Tax=Paraconiothyrium brasiliense TaxID=300254 RepID=A0ABR3S0A6_9PLEO
MFYLTTFVICATDVADAEKKAAILFAETESRGWRIVLPNARDWRPNINDLRLDKLFVGVGPIAWSQDVTVASQIFSTNTLLDRALLSFGKTAAIETAPLSLQPQWAFATLNCVRKYTMWGKKLLVRQ